MKRSAEKASRLKRVVLTGTGTLCVALGVIGMLLPLLPTTPFLLLAAACYARSSPRFYHWLLTNRWCGVYIRNYRAGRGLPRQQKILTLALLWATIGVTAIFVVPLWWVRVLLLAIATGVTLHLLRIPTFKPGAPAAPAAVLPAATRVAHVMTPAAPKTNVVFGPRK